MIVRERIFPRFQQLCSNYILAFQPRWDVINNDEYFAGFPRLRADLNWKKEEIPPTPSFSFSHNLSQLLAPRFLAALPVSSPSHYQPQNGGCGRKREVGRTNKPSIWNRHPPRCRCSSTIS